MSPRAAKKRVVVEVELEVTPRDYVLARLAAARSSAMQAVNAIDDAISCFMEPEEDEDGAERKELVEAALEHAGAATRALECAEEILPQVDNAECEPWDEDADEDDADDPDEDEDDEDAE